MGVQCTCPPSAQTFSGLAGRRPCSAPGKQAPKSVSGQEDQPKPEL